MSKVMVGIPMHKGDVCAATMQSVAVGATANHEMNFQLLGLSLLAKNFNMLFISAVTKGYDYFVLHHSDLGVQGMVSDFTSGSWIDLLITRLHENELSALSSAVVIKSDDGVTSSGILTTEGDPWSLRRTTIKELNRLPTKCVKREHLLKEYDLKSEEAGALLINSGLLIMDIRDSGGIWRVKEWTGFNIYDEIAWSKDGVPESFTIPEDWNMSIWCHENDVPYGFTRELVISHMGQKAFMNVGDWGVEADMIRQQMSADEYRQMVVKGRRNV